MLSDTLAPGPPQLPIIGSLHLLRKDHLGFYEQLRRYGPLSHFRAGRLPITVVSDATEIESVLSKQARYFQKPSTYKSLNAVLGVGLVNANGEKWARLRRLTIPAFSESALQNYSQQMEETIQGRLDEWEKEAGAVIDLVPKIQELTLLIACATFFGTRLKKEELAITGPIFGNLTKGRRPNPLTFLSLLPTRRNLAYARRMRALKQFVDGLIEKRRATLKSAEAPSDLLGSLLLQPQALSPRELRDTVLTLLFAGHETSASALGWTLFLLGRNPEAYEKVQRESDETASLPLCEENLKTLPYTHQALLEAMRLYPSIPVISRQATQPVTLGHFTLPRGRIVSISIHAVQRDPRYWPDPERFDPDRFSAENEAGRNPFTYLAFARGPRSCMGERFALWEMKWALAKILQRFDVQLAPEANPKPVRAISLRLGGGLPVVLHRR